jgi:hypothetical protein
MLAYVFWHYPTATEDASRYEERLVAFHHALRSAKPDGFVRSAAYRIHGAPWLPGAGGYEDWYEIKDWAALGVLNTAAVSGPVRPDHDAAARLADGGAGGLYQLLRQAAESAMHSGALWLTKPRDRAYPDFMAGLGALAAGCAVWQRQLVLGPAPEFCVAGPEAAVGGLQPPPEWLPRLIRRRPLSMTGS